MPGRELWPKKLVMLSNGSHAPLEQPAFSELSTEVTAFLREHVLDGAPRLRVTSS